MLEDFAVFILTHGRAGRVDTHRTLRDAGYTGEIFFIIDNEDPQAREYKIRYKNVIQFNKASYEGTFDKGDNFSKRNSVIYARNACFDIAEKLGYRYFIELDDDYTIFEFRLYQNNDAKPRQIKTKMNDVFSCLLDFYKATPFQTIAIAQGGDFIGGRENRLAHSPFLHRKCMNSFLCSPERRFEFSGRLNDDVNTYIARQATGGLMGTIPFISLTQRQTQSNQGGLTDAYLDNGTYVKSFYTVMFSPSCCTIRLMGATQMRIHHNINWETAVPKILSQDQKKT